MQEDATRTPLRRGWTTGACATAAARSALGALLGGDFADPVTIVLPKGQRVAFVLDGHGLIPDGSAWAAVIKDAGDDPDITHGARIIARIRLAETPGITFAAGEGVGTVTRPGLPLPVGEPAINPVPRAMIQENLGDVAAAHGQPLAARVEIAIENGAELAKRTMNGRLGILGGLSVLGTTGIVIPYSCAAWIASIHQAVDVGRATGCRHMGASTGKTSEDTLRIRFGLAESELIEMGDFAGGLLKYLRRNPLPRLTIAGGFAKLAKLAAGHLDLHSARSRLDPDWMADQVAMLRGGTDLVAACRNADSGGQILGLCREQNISIGQQVASLAREQAQQVAGPDTTIDVLVVDRQGHELGHADG